MLNRATQKPCSEGEQRQWGKAQDNADASFWDNQRVTDFKEAPDKSALQTRWVGALSW